MSTFYGLFKMTPYKAHVFYFFLADMFDLYNIFSIFAEIKVVHG